MVAAACHISVGGHCPIDGVVVLPSEGRIHSIT